MQKELNFGVVPVGLKHPKTIIIKNVFRTNAIFNITEVPLGLQIEPVRGKIGPDGKQNLTISFSTTAEIELDA